MQNIIRIALALALLPLTASPSRASAHLPHVVVSELQTGTTISATNEFVELYNPTSSEISLQGWSIEYKAATSANVETSWTKKASLQGDIPPHGFYLIAPKAYLSSADAELFPTLAASGGTIRLKSIEGLVVDQLGYGATANAAEGTPAPAPVYGGSIERLPGCMQQLGGNGSDTDDNGIDFIERPVAEPQSISAAPEPLSELPAEEVEEIPEPTPVVVPNVGLVINEILVDPITPLNDSEDEFIELYNPSTEPIDLKDYTLRCGANFRDYYTITNQVLGPGGYLILYSKETKLGLTNSGGAVQLLDPSGIVIDESPAYEEALPGQSWAAFTEGWQWTLQLTPGQVNKLEALPVPVSPASTVNKPKTVSKKAAIKSPAKPKKAAVSKTAKPKKPKKAKVAKTQFAAVPAAASANLQPATWLIISLAILSIGYACYEFRYDLYNLYYKLRRNHRVRPKDREVPDGRRRG